MNPKRTPPSPIFDTLQAIGNPFKQRQFSVKSYFTAPEIAPAGAETDFEFALKFLYSYNGSTATFNSYRRELERFIQWAWRIEILSILELRRENIEDYINFCQNPPKAWIGEKNVPRYVLTDGIRKPNEEWRPFVVSIAKEQFRKGVTPDRKDYVMAQPGIRAIFTALSSFYDYLCQENLTDMNPVALIRQKNKFIRKDHNKAPVRRISTLQWEYVIETAEHMAAESPEPYERTLFIMKCLYAIYLRISELVSDERHSPIMGDFKKDHNGL